MKSSIEIETTKYIWLAPSLSRNTGMRANKPRWKEAEALPWLNNPLLHGIMPIGVARCESPSCSRLQLLQAAFFVAVATVGCTEAYVDKLEDNLHQSYHETMETPKRAKVLHFEQDFHAVGDGVTLNTKAFERAVETARLYNEHHKHEKGVELIVGVPNGNKSFVTGPFNLTSHFTLTVSEQNSIVASPDPSAWPLIDPLPSYGQGRDHKGPRRVPFIGAFNVSDVAVRGPGTIDGNGKSWWKRHLDGSEKYTRGRLIETLWSDGVLLEELNLRNSPFWTVHPTYSSNIVARGLNIVNPDDAPNTDGFDPDSSINVTLIDSYFSVGDDGVAIKSGWDCFGIDYDLPCKNILIRNLTVNSHCCAGICIGSEWHRMACGPLQSYGEL